MLQSLKRCLSFPLHERDKKATVSLKQGGRGERVSKWENVLAQHQFSTLPQLLTSPVEFPELYWTTKLFQNWTIGNKSLMK